MPKITALQCIYFVPYTTPSMGNYRRYYILNIQIVLSGDLNVCIAFVPIARL